MFGTSDHIASCALRQNFEMLPLLPISLIACACLIGVGSCQSRTSLDERQEIDRKLAQIPAQGMDILTQIAHASPVAIDTRKVELRDPRNHPTYRIAAIIRKAFKTQGPLTTGRFDRLYGELVEEPCKAVESVYSEHQATCDDDQSGLTYLKDVAQVCRGVLSSKRAEIRYRCHEAGGAARKAAKRRSTWRQFTRLGPRAVIVPPLSRRPYE